MIDEQWESHKLLTYLDDEVIDGITSIAKSKEKAILYLEDKYNIITKLTVEDLRHLDNMLIFIYEDY